MCAKYMSKLTISVYLSSLREVSSDYVAEHFGFGSSSDLSVR